MSQDSPTKASSLILLSSIYGRCWKPKGKKRRGKRRGQRGERRGRDGGDNEHREERKEAGHGLFSGCALKFPVIPGESEVRISENEIRGIS